MQKISSIDSGVFCIVTGEGIVGKASYSGESGVVDDGGAFIEGGADIPTQPDIVTTKQIRMRTMQNFLT